MQTSNYKIKKSNFEITSHNYDKVQIESCNYEEKVTITRDSHNYYCRNYEKLSQLYVAIVAEVTVMRYKVTL